MRTAKSAGNPQTNQNNSEDEIKYEPPKVPIMKSEIIRPFSHKPTCKVNEFKLN